MSPIRMAIKVHVAFAWKLLQACFYPNGMYTSTRYVVSIELHVHKEDSQRGFTAEAQERAPTEYCIKRPTWGKRICHSRAATVKKEHTVRRMHIT